MYNMIYKKIKSSQLGEIDYMLYKFILESIYRVNKEVKITILKKNNNNNNNNNTVIFDIKYKNRYILYIVSKENELILYRHNIINHVNYDKISLNYNINWTQTMAKTLIDLQFQMLL